MTILFVSGVNDLSKVGVKLDDKGGLMYLLDGNCSIHRRVPLIEGIAEDVVLFGKGVKQRTFNFVKMPSLIFNQISDVDTHRGALERCIELCSQVDSTVINHPENILQTSRDRVSELLQGIPGVTMPRTVRFKPASPEDVFVCAESENFDFPFIVRVAGDHGGKSMVRVSSREDFKSLHAYPFDGRDFYLTQYVDSKDSTGHYQRLRLVVINGEPVLRGLLYDKSWMVHGASRGYMLKQESWEQDRARAHMLETEIIPGLKPAVQEITRRLKLEFYGIDCSLSPEREMLIFEANANMNILTNDHPQMNERMNMITSKIQALLTRFSGEKVI
jgi:glutathione synthase/RimK-type ligase-like ATP-grasp enzyme